MVTVFFYRHDKKTMPFFNLATTDDHDELEQSLNKTFKQTVKNKDLVGDILSRVEMIDSRLKDNNDRIMKDHDGYRDDISRLDTCTKLIKGVYVCDKPMYEKVIAPRDLKVKDVTSPSSNICLKVETLDDLFESETIKHELGTRDVPDNYLCLEKTHLEQYVDAFIPDRILRYADTVKDKNIIEVQRPHCYSACHKYTCEEIKNKQLNNQMHYYFPKTVEIGCGACSAKAKCKPFA